MRGMRRATRLVRVGSQQGDSLTDGEIFVALWAQADVVVLATGIYMERHRIGWWSARDTLHTDAAKGGVTVDVLAEQVVRGLDKRRA